MNNSPAPDQPHLFAKIAGLLVIADIALLLVWDKTQRFEALSWSAYSRQVLDEVAKITGWTAVILAFVVIVLQLFLGRSKKNEPALSKELYAALLARTASLARRRNPAASLLALSVGGIVLVGWLLTNTRQLYVPPASSIVASPDGREVYVVAPPNVIAFDVSGPADKSGGRPYRELAIAGNPIAVAVGPRREEIYVLDASREAILVFSRRFLKEVARIPVGLSPRAIAITADETKAFVSNEQPRPQGSIMVVSLDERKVIDTITGVNCPEGLAVTPDASRLYVASQCGARKDPVFVVDVKSHRIISSITGNGTGSTVVMRPDGKRVYLSWDDVVSVVRTNDNVVVDTLVVPNGALAITPDSRSLIIASPSGIIVVNALTNDVVRSLKVSPPAGIAITPDGRGFGWYPPGPRPNRTEGHLWEFGTGGILEDVRP